MSASSLLLSTKDFCTNISLAQKQYLHQSTLKNSLSVAILLSLLVFPRFVLLYTAVINLRSYVF